MADAVVKRTIAKTLLEEMPLADEITDALLKGSGPFAGILNNTLAYERGDWEAIDCPQLSASAIADLYMQALEWANITVKTLHSKDS